MRQLLLLRHAKSSWDEATLSDHARPLNARGRRAAAAMGERLRELGLVPDIVLVSSARRTLQTLEGLQPLEGPPVVHVLDALYLAPWGTMLEGLRKVPDTARSVLVLAHNPGLHDLAMALVGPGAVGSPAAQRLAEGYPTGALAEFSVAARWQDLAEGGGRLLRFLCPRDLPELAA
ncbi:SixA phosphatase family protein [Roseococcus sp. DSY-14]|uniref:SixA phosphatase family protein n=1 Tax=Roseococcus sp. DSY-14 TaxID=3369650 RepID=UPI00387B0D5B